MLKRTTKLLFEASGVIVLLFCWTFGWNTVLFFHMISLSCFSIHLCFLSLSLQRTITVGESTTLWLVWSLPYLSTYVLSLLFLSTNVQGIGTQTYVSIPMYLCLVFALFIYQCTRYRYPYLCNYTCVSMSGLCSM